MTSITAIIPTFNRAHFLNETLESLSRQSRPVEEIIVWDDGSTDGTQEVIAESPVPLRYFRSENGGKSRALNHALREARGDLIWICDDDDIALPNAAETLAGMLERAPKAGFAAGCYRRFREDPGTGTRSESGPGYWPDLSNGSVLRHLLEDIFLFQNAMLVRRSLYERAGAFREDLARSIDYDMVVRLALRAPAEVTDAPIFRQRKHDGARGPAAARHAAASSDQVWKSADRDVFAPFRESIPLSLYAALFEGPGATRAGLLQRACVYARRTDWAAALADFESAAAQSPETGLSGLERDICRRAMAGKHGVQDALDTQTRRRIARLARTSPAGAQIAAALARGILWHGRTALKDGRTADAAAVARFAAGAKLAGLGARTGAPAPDVAERRELPDGAWLA
ncbi:glycosyltransferase [Poseidonocella sp. HB161398]|uniref:glycosyltransferase n=1 Tax=Poseidonocella sp. HB161398 TaxID=2320855 RepID=UPI001F0DAF0F|nr:glycosyltransferase [Poseidonocella sp. HB161398]